MIRGARAALRPRARRSRRYADDAIAGRRRPALRRRDGLVAARRVHAGVGQPRVGRQGRRPAQLQGPLRAAPTRPRRRARPRRAAAARTGTGSTRARSGSSSTPSPTPTETWPDWAQQAASRCSPRPRPTRRCASSSRPATGPRTASGRSTAATRSCARSSTGSDERFPQVRPQPGRRTATTTSARNRRRTSSTSPPASAAARWRPRRPPASGPTASGPPWVAFRAIHHGFVKLTVRDEGIALEAICAGRRRPRTASAAPTARSWTRR